jgi:hypothetical protein
MARLVGIPYFSSDEFWEATQVYNSQLRKFKAQMARGGWDDEPNPLPGLQNGQTRYLRSYFENRLIRRTGTSKDNCGNQLLTLPKITRIALTVSLQSREREYLFDSIPDDAMER